MELLINQEFRNLIPPLAPEELRLLEESILEEGVRDALVLWNGYIVDGHNRYDIIAKHSLTDYRVVNKKFADTTEAKIWIKRNQISRRNIAPYLRAEYYMEVEEWEERKRQASEKSKANLKHQNVDIRISESRDLTKELADKIGVHKDTASKIIQIHRKATEEQKEKLRKGDATVNQVYVQVCQKAVKDNIKTASWPEGIFRIIYADPPWAYSNNQADYHSTQDDYYPTMPLTDICALPIQAADNAVLFLWATSPILEDAFKVIKSWGFEYKTSFVWDKVKHNLGHYNSVRHEFLLVAVRGSCQPDVLKMFDSVVTIERNGRHSHKPAFFREMIDILYPYGPRIELFATEKTEGWEVYGNQITA